MIPELEPRIFSFNSPHGACERCTGLGSMMEIDPELVVPDPTLSIGEGAIAPWANSSSNYYEQITAGARRASTGIDLEAPWDELARATSDLFLYGTDGDRIEVSYRNRYGRRRSYATRFEGIVAEPRAPLPRDRLRARRARRSRSSCRWCRARRARARGCGRSRARCSSAACAIHEFTAMSRASARSSGSTRSS